MGPRSGRGAEAEAARGRPAPAGAAPRSLILPITLLLTATITPPASGVPGLIRTEPGLRLRDYLAAFEFYLKQPSELIERIVFADNSASDVSPLLGLVEQFGYGKQVYVTSHQGLDHDPALGRGYGEMKLLDYLVDTYEPVASLPADTVLWKGTGRYQLTNIAPIIRAAPKHYDLYCDLKDRPHHRFDMRFFSFTLRGYRRIFSGLYRDMRETVMTPDGPMYLKLPEIQMREWVDPYLARLDPAVIPRFRVEPWVDGVRAWDNVAYNRGKGVVKYMIRAGSRRIAPKFWI